MFKRSLLTALAPFAILVVLAHQSVAEVDRPNFVLMFVDNVGYGDLGCYGNTEVKTPNIDRLATEGVRCTDFYIGSPSCTPSRGALLTGRHPERNGLNHQLSPAQDLSEGLPLRERIIPQYLKPLGYTCGAFGKWNLGFGEGYRPTDRGFDQFFGQVSGCMNYFTHFHRGRNDLRRGTEMVTVKGYSTDLFADEAVHFITRHAKRPFFVYLPFNATHYPLPQDCDKDEPVVWQAPEKYLKMYGVLPGDDKQQQRFYAMLTALDDAVGRVLKALDELKLRDNTIVILLSDNGAFMLPGAGLGVQSNHPFRDGGVTCYEGGIRVPSMVRWPGRISQNTVCREMLSSLDLLPMIVNAAGGRLPEDRVFDGKDPTATLAGEATSPHEQLCWVWRNHSAIRKGKYKLARSNPKRNWELYDLDKDMGETTDLAQKHRQLAEQLQSRFGQWLSGIHGEREHP